jgi:hypothetical protein
MDIKEGLVEIDPGDIDQLASSPVRFPSESSNDARKQILQELPQPTMAMEIRSDETCDEPNTRTMEEEGAEGVESGHLSGSFKPPNSTAETPIFPPQQPLVKLWEPFKGDVSFDELTKTLQESQLKSLRFGFDEDQENGNNSMGEAYKNHRLQVLDVVSRCNSLKELQVASTLGGEEMDVLCQNLVSHPALEILTLHGVNDKGVEMLCCMLKNNHNIKDLYVVQVEGDQGVEMLCQMLQNNHSIKTLTLAPINAIGVASVGLMLGVNSTLENLTLWSNYDADGDTLKVLLQPLTSDDANQSLNRSIKQLHLFHTRMGQEGAKVVAQMLLTNDSITHFKIAADKSLEPSDVCTILESLEKNETLHTLDLRWCNGVQGDDVLAKVMDLLRINPWLKKIDLAGTQLERDGHHAQVNAQLASNARDYIATLSTITQLPIIHDKIINKFLVELQNRQVPCNVYFTTTRTKFRQPKFIVNMLRGIKTVQLHLLCECVEGIHVVDGQEGCEVSYFKQIGLNIFSLLLKVGAHIVARIGDRVPNVEKGLPLALDTQSLNDYLPNSSIHQNSQNDPFQGLFKDAAEQWLVDFLKNQNISKSFGLSKVHYHGIKYGNQGPLIRWICNRHKEEGLKKGILKVLPVTIS